MRRDEFGIDHELEAEWRWWAKTMADKQAAGHPEPVAGNTERDEEDGTR